MRIKGIDVSKHQGKIDWDKVANDGVKFAIVRAGWTWYEGGLTEDTCFKYNVENAIKNGVDVGVYVYSYDRSVEGARLSARKLLDLIKPYKLTYPIIYDMEYEEFNKTTGKGKLNTDICIAFLEEIEKAKYYSMLYASTDFFKHYLQDERLTKYDKWVAQYASSCTYQGDFGIWQYSSTGSVDGVNGNCDLNWSYKDYSEVIADLGLNGLEPVVPPVQPTPPVDEVKYLRVGGFDSGNMEKGESLKAFLDSMKIYSEWE